MVCQLIQKFDIAFFYFINSNLQNNLFDFLMPIISQLGSVYFIAAVGLSLLLFKKRGIKEAGLLTLTGLAVSETISTILKEIISRPRPVTIIENIHLLCHKSYTHSFPSGHTTLAFTIAAIIASLYPKLRFILFALAISIGFSRIYIGAHFPTDVIAGAILGIFIGFIITRVWKKSPITSL